MPIREKVACIVNIKIAVICMMLIVPCPHQQNVRMGLVKASPRTASLRCPCRLGVPGPPSPHRGSGCPRDLLIPLWSQSWLGWGQGSTQGHGWPWAAPVFSQPGNQATALDPADSPLITSPREDAQERSGLHTPRVLMQKPLPGAGKEGNRVPASRPSPGGSSKGGAALLRTPRG